MSIMSPSSMSSSSTLDSSDVSRLLDLFADSSAGDGFVLVGCCCWCFRIGSSVVFVVICAPLMFPSPIRLPMSPKALRIDAVVVSFRSLSRFR